MAPKSRVAHSESARAPVRRVVVDDTLPQQFLGNDIRLTSRPPDHLLHPLTDPPLRPATSCRCTTMKIKRRGTDIIVQAAITTPQEYRSNWPTTTWSQPADSAW